MNLVISNKEKIKTFTSVFQNLKLFGEHLNLFFEKERIYAQGMDNSHVSIFEIHIPASWFDVYNYTGEASSHIIGINTVLLFKILSTREENQELNIEFDENATDNLLIHFIGQPTAKSTAKEYDKHFTVPLISLESELMDIPGFECSAEFSLESPHFSTIVNQLKLFGTDITIQCNEEEIRLVSDGRESGNMSVVIPIDDLNMFAIAEGEQLKLSFSLVHMANICSFHKVSGQILIELSNEYPLRVTYYLDKFDADDEAAKEKAAKLLFFLAPRVSDNE